MNKAAKALYIVSIVLSPILLISGIVLAASSSAASELVAKEAGVLAGFGAAYGIYFLIISIPCLIFSILGCVAIGKGKTGKAVYILSIVFGALGVTTLLVAGILATIWASKASKDVESKEE